MGGHPPGKARPCHYGKTRLSDAARAAVKAYVLKVGPVRAVRDLGTSPATLDKALHGLAMLAVTADRFEAWAKGGGR